VAYASLLQQLNGLDGGIDTGHDLFHKLCAIMFVDDLFTLATSLEDIHEQINTIQDWALETHNIISFEKSTITTSPLTPTQAAALKIKCPTTKHTKNTTQESLWLLHDTGITPPATLVAINDCTTLILAKQGLTDYVSSAILPLDTALIEANNTFLGNINTQEDYVSMQKKGDRTNYLITRARKAYIEGLHEPHISLATTLSPILSTIHSLQPKEQTALIRARFFHCHPPTEPCPHCYINSPHTVTHAVWFCLYHPLMTRRQTQIKPEDLPHILNGEEGKNHTDDHPILKQVLYQLSWSPYYYPRTI
jgi:hypothetical protein